MQREALLDGQEMKKMKEQFPAPWTPAPCAGGSVICAAHSQPIISI